jgi:hypothetical protein
MLIVLTRTPVVLTTRAKRWRRLAIGAAVEAEQGPYKANRLEMARSASRP